MDKVLQLYVPSTVVCHQTYKFGEKAVLNRMYLKVSRYYLFMYKKPKIQKALHKTASYYFPLNIIFVNLGRYVTSSSDNHEKKLIF